MCTKVDCMSTVVDPQKCTEVSTLLAPLFICDALITTESEGVGLLSLAIEQTFIIMGLGFSCPL